jgi:hypothetical protein
MVSFLKAEPEFWVEEGTKNFHTASLSVKKSLLARLALDSYLEPQWVIDSSYYSFLIDIKFSQIGNSGHCA